MTECAVPSCDRPRSKRDWCGKHYLRWWRHGDPEHESTKHEACIVAGCATRPRSSRSGLCERHYYRARRHGDVNALVDTRQAVCQYRAAHARIARERGRAADHGCVDCSRPAAHWSYDHSDPDALTSPGGQPYSLDTARYQPRCRACHAQYDGTGANQYGDRETARLQPGGWNA